MLAAVTVTNDLDIVNGDTSSIANLISSDGGDGIALREAIVAANNTSGADDITFDFGHDGPETILLELGELAITEAVTITGDGPDLLTIDASGNDPTPDVDQGDGSRIFNINDGYTALLDAQLNNLTLTGGDVSGRGGAVSSRENLSVVGITITGNSAGNIGGGIFSRARTTITGSTISGNEANSRGGGVSNSGTLAITSSTLSANSAVLGGGGIYSNNTNGTVTLNGSLAAANVVLLSSQDVEGPVNGAYNLIGDGTGMSGLVDGVNGNQVGSGASPIDPLLGPLQDNGGPTETHALLPGSPAIDAGDPSFTAPPDYDQRGTNYERVQAGRIDVGAYELLIADGNLDGQVDGLDYLLWAGFYPDDPAQDPPGTPQNGDYNNDGVVDGLDYLEWAGQYNEGVPALPTSQTGALASEELSAVDAALESDYDVGTAVAGNSTVNDWQISRAFDSLLKKTRGRRRK